MKSLASPLRVLAFESFDAGSHRQTRRAVETHCHLDWRWLTLPGRGWKWRMRTGAAELAAQVRVAAEEGKWGDWRPDVVFATSLISLGDLIAQLPRAWRTAVSVLYMHENQLVYPVRPEHAAEDDRDLQFAVTNLMSMLAADRVLFNSRWNRDSFLDGIGREAGRSPEGALKRIGADLRTRSEVVWPPVELPMPVEPPSGTPRRVLHNAPVVVWPHRWEHDKGPDELLEIARRMRGRTAVKWVLLGERFRIVPEAMERFLEEFEDDILHCGRIDDRDEYLAMLGSCDWVLSTASHEFFGIAVVEAMWMGCMPWLPGRLSYPELVPAGCIGLTPEDPPEGPGGLVESIRRHLGPCRSKEAVRRIEKEIVAAYESSV